ncbi:5'-nucleotidase C-terminal domain-containing protein [Nocardioides lijunqiniae]|uniref:5'-nucleotidase C-terminal domain-containing protein n=1 Tax=Nocardioides lijunqiniae TaxID=2760832 RepID=UPI001877CB33
MSSRTRQSLSAVLGLTLAATALSLVQAPAAHAAPVDLTLLDINDYHGRISSDGGSGSAEATTYSTVELATTIQGIRSAEGDANVLFVSAGDNIGASLFTSAFTEDQPTIDVLNALGLASSTLGNHELDKGYDWLQDNVVEGTADYREASFPILGANVYLKGTTTPALREYSTHQVAGVDVCMIGAVTEETPTLVSPSGIASLEFGDPVAAVNRVAGQLEAADTCDVIVASYHEGAGAGTPDNAALEDEVAAGGAFADIVTTTAPAVDVIFTGHTHKEYVWNADKPGGGTRPVVQTGSYGTKIGQVDLAYDPDTDVVSVPAAKLVTVGTTENLADPVVAEVDGIVRSAEAAANVVGDVPVGEVTDDVTSAYSGGSYGPDGYTGGTRDNRLSESTLGNLVADALRETPITDIPGLTSPDIGLVNPGGLRNELLYAANLAASPQDAPGVVTFEEANAVLPFANNISYVTLTGAELRKVLEQQWQTTADGVTRPSRPFLHLGLSKNVQVIAKPDTSATSPVGNNILSVTIDGRPVVDDREYVVSTFSFLATGGDNFRAFKEGTNRDTGKVDRDLWINGYFGDDEAKSPSFARRQVFATGVGATPVQPGDQLDLQLTKLDLTSLGAPLNTAVEASVVLGDTVTSLGSSPVANGTADVDVTVPDDAYGATVRLVAQPSGTTVSIPVAKAASSVSASARRTSYGQPVPVDVVVDSEARADGTVTVTAGSRVVGTGTVTDGRGTVTIPGRTLEPGTTALTATFSGPQAENAATALRATVTKASATVTATKRTGKVVVRRTRAVVKVVVRTFGQRATGKVTVRVAGRTYTRTLRSGVATVQLKRFTAAGRRTVVVRYLGNALTLPARDTLALKVTKR